MLVMRVYPHRAGLKNMPGHGGNRTTTFGILAHHKHLIHLSTLHAPTQQINDKYIGIKSETARAYFK
jgi:hypothetical protein